MSTELPIACSLTAAELGPRVDEMRALGDAALVDVETEPARATLRFAAARGVRERVDAVVAAESECCAFLTMRVDEDPDRVVLTIEAPAGAELVLEEMVAAFRG